MQPEKKTMMAALAIVAALSSATGGAFAQTLSPTYKPGTSTPFTGKSTTVTGSRSQVPHTTVPPAPRTAVIRHFVRTAPVHTTPQPLPTHKNGPVGP